MERINLNDIDFTKLETKKNYSGGIKPATFYVDKENNKLFKMFSDTYRSESELKKFKLEEFDKVETDSLSKTKEIIYDTSRTMYPVGYTQELIDGDTLYSNITKKGLLNNMKYILEASKNLEDLHQKDIIVSYMHFINVMVDKDEKTKFISKENYQINNLKAEGTTVLLNNYFAQKNKKVEKNENSDIINFYLSLFDKIFGREIYCVKPESYNSELGTYPFLQDLYPVFIDLSKRSSKVPEVPYLHKVLKNYDNE